MASSSTEFQDLLRDFNANRNAENKRLNSQIIIPSASSEVPPSENKAIGDVLKTSLVGVPSYQVKYEKYLNRSYKIDFNKASFRGLENFGKNLEAPKLDFDDNQPILSEEAVLLEKLPVKKLLELGRQTIPRIHSGFTKKSAADLLVLAYNLKYGKGELHDAITEEALNVENDTTADTLSTVNFPGFLNFDPIISSPNESLEVAFYTFLAASTLRMFTKTTENYIQAWNHIIKRFRDFYTIEPPVALHPPRRDSLDPLVGIWKSDPIFKPTLYKFLYVASTGTKESQGVRIFLYEQHLANTGLHILKSSTDLCDRTGCTAVMLLSVLNIKAFEKQVKALKHLILMGLSTDTKYSRKMWRYGRLFDETFMTPIQTKNCSLLMGCIACALVKVSPVDFGGLLKIKALENLGPENIDKCKAVGAKLIKHLGMKTKD